MSLQCINSRFHDRVGCFAHGHGLFSTWRVGGSSGGDISLGEMKFSTSAEANDHQSHNWEPSTSRGIKQAEAPSSTQRQSLCLPQQSRGEPVQAQWRADVWGEFWSSATPAGRRYSPDKVNHRARSSIKPADDHRLAAPSEWSGTIWETPAERFDLLPISSMKHAVCAGWPWTHRR